VSETPPLIEKYQQLDGIEYSMDRHELVDCVKRKTVPIATASIFHYPDPAFDLGYVLVGTCQVDHRATWHGFNQGIERCEFTIGMYCRDVVTTL
jgi:hypothetical protein